MSKKYGLIKPGETVEKQKPVSGLAEKSKHSIFDESSSDEEGGPTGLPQLKSRMAPMAAGTAEKRIARQIQEKALKEDPTVFQYDELYDEMESQRNAEKNSKSNEVRKPKYIGKLIENAEKRKIENERRIERAVQKEREQEGDEFKDKESFVTSAYRKKLEEMRLVDEQEKREDYLEAIGDVTKQKDLDGFYRHLYEQKVGTIKPIPKPNEPVTHESSAELSYKPIKSAQRTYRKRRVSEEEEENDKDTSKANNKKSHLQSNLDADSDFSIDSSSSDDENDAEAKKTLEKPRIELNGSTKATSLVKEEPLSVTTNDNGPKNNIICDVKQEKTETEKNTKEDVKDEPPKPKKDKTLIWKKRTVGEVYEAAVKRYYERLAARNAA